MNEKAVIENALTMYLEQIGSSTLSELSFAPVTGNELDWYLVRMGQIVPPAYLPFAADDNGILGIHLWPGRALSQSPIVYIDTDEPNVSFVCENLRLLPTGMWLWVARYYKEEADILRQNIEKMTDQINNAYRVPEALWTLLVNSPDYEPTWWTPDCESYTEEAWQLANVGHPFVGLPKIDFFAEPDEALSQLRSFVMKRREPELVSIFVAAQLSNGVLPDREDVLAVLSAEIWRGSKCLLDGLWRMSGEGICAWDAVLSHLPAPETFLHNTPFAALGQYPDTYRGSRKDDPLRLAQIGQIFREMQDQASALRQLRNSMLLATLALGQFPRELALIAAATCDAIEVGSLAAAVARHTAQLDRSTL